MNPRLSHRHRHRSAFSLIEVLCAVLILGVGITGLTLGVTTAVQSSKESELITAAALFASGQIETIRAEGYVFAGDDEGDCDFGLASCQWKQSITETSVEGLFEVSVSVLDGPTGSMLYELRTLLFDPPVYSMPDETESSDAQSSGAGRGRGGGA